MNEVLAIIPARGGSKGILRKNLRPFAGRPLVAHSIQHALKSSLVTRTVVSTDDDEIAALAASCGAGVVHRPPALSGDAASTESALLHALDVLALEEGYRPELVVLLQATSPIRESADIDGALRLLRETGADSLLSACPSHDFLWTTQGEAGGGGVWAQPLNYDPVRRPRRQDMPPQFRENGSIYITRAAGLIETGSRLFGRIAAMPMSAAKSLQIDSPEDFEMAQAVYERLRPEMLAPVLAAVRLVVFDFDGVFTTNQVLVNQDGTEGVLCNRSDGLGLGMLREAGIDAAVVTAEMNPVVLRRCEKLKLECVQVPKEKLPALKQLLAAKKVDPAQVAYVGNDVNDLPCMNHVGCSIAVADAWPTVLGAASVVTTRRGGLGAVREVCDWFLHARPGAG